MYLISVIMQEVYNPALRSWTEYGALGVIIAFLIWYVVYLTKQHKSEREEWRKDTQEIIRENIKSNKELTSAIQNLKGILETIQRRTDI